MTDFLPISLNSVRQTHAQPSVAVRARDAAQKLEASFLAEMLKSAGFGKSSSFAGGIGEEQFASFQRQALAEEIAKSGGLGLAETFFNSTMETYNDQ